MSEKSISKREEKFKKHLDEKDALQIVIRGHLYVEAELLDLLGESIAMVRPKAIDLGDLSFRKKIELAIALGLLAPENKRPFLELNALRNKVAHNLDLVISPDHIEKLYSSFSSFFKYLYGTKPSSFRYYKAILKQCLAVMWIHLNHSRLEQHRLKQKSEEDHKKVVELLEKHKSQVRQLD